MMRHWILIAPLLAIAAVGCKREDDEKIDFGPSVSAATISEALNAPIASSDPFAIKVGEFRATAYDQEIIGVNGSKQVVQAEGVTIISRTEEPARIVFGTVIAKNTYQSDGTIDKVAREGSVCLPKVSGGCDAGASSLSASIEDVRAYSNPTTLLTKAVEEMASSVTFHRLILSDRIVPVPELVRARTNCGGVAQCQMHEFNVSFDQVNWSDGKGSKIHIDVRLSPNVPFLSNQLTTCYTQLVPVGQGGSRVLVKQCSDVYDFRFDDASGPASL